MAERPQQLAHLEFLGDAIRFAGHIHALIPKCTLLENFMPAEVRLLTSFMDVYRAADGIEIIREGDGGDFMLMVVEGRVEVRKSDRWNTPQLIAVLGRESLARIIVEQPMLGAKVLMELVLMLSQRLRATSDRLMQLLDEQGQRSAGLL